MDTDEFIYQAVDDDENIKVIFVYPLIDVTHQLSTGPEYIRGKIPESITASDGAPMTVLNEDHCTLARNHDGKGFQRVD